MDPMDFRTATNPTTGERVIRIAGAWRPLEATATNPQTGAKGYRVGGQWLYAPVAAPAETYSQRVKRTGDAFDRAVAAGGAGPVRRVARTVDAALQDTLAMGSSFAGDLAGAATSIATQNAKRGDAVRQALTYTPESAAGRAGEEYIGALAAPIGEVVNAPQRYLERHGHPIASQALTAAEDVAGGEEAEAGRGVKALTRARQADEAVREGERAGFVLPISQSRPGIISKLAEAVSGKIHTQQALSGLNVEQGNALVRKGLGLTEDAPLNAETMAAVRRRAGMDYEAVKSIPGKVRQSQAFADKLEEIASSREGGIRAAAEDDPIRRTVAEIDKAGPFTTAQGLNEVRSLRDEAEKAFRGGDKRLGQDYKRIATAIEERIGDHLEASGAPRSLIDSYRSARTRIAQAYDVEDALDGAGNVDMRKLGKDADKMTGELGTAARFGKNSPKYAQPPKVTGSKLPFSLVGAAATGGMGALAGAGHGHALAGAVAAEAARMAVQKLTTTRLGQRALRAADEAARKTVRTTTRAGAATLPLSTTLRDLNAQNQNQGVSP